MFRKPYKSVILIYVFKRIEKISYLEIPLFYGEHNEIGGVF